MRRKNKNKEPVLAPQIEARRYYNGPVFVVQVVNMGAGEYIECSRCTPPEALAILTHLTLNPFELKENKGLFYANVDRKDGDYPRSPNLPSDIIGHMMAGGFQLLTFGKNTHMERYVFLRPPAPVIIQTT